MISDSNNRRYTLPSTSFVDPAIVRFVDKSHTLPGQQILECYDDEYEEEDTTTVPSSITSSPLMTQRLSPPQPTASTSLDHLFSKQERYDNMELRLFALEESEKRFERRLQSLEKERSHHLLTLQRQPMKPDQQSSSTDIMQNDLDDAHDDNKNYIQLYNSLLEKYNALQQEFKNKEKQYQDKIQQLLKSQQPQPPQKKEPVEQKPCYREEDGYLLFDTTNMNGEIMHCKVKIPSNNQRQYQPVKRGNFITTTLTNRLRVPPQQQHHHHITSPKTALNPNAPEWKKKDRRI